MALTAKDVHIQMGNAYHKYAESIANGENDVESLQAVQHRLEDEFFNGLHERFSPHLSKSVHEQILSTTHSMTFMRVGPGYYEAVENAYNSLRKLVDEAVKDALKANDNKS